VVVLFRASSNISLYEEALRRQQIPFNVAEGAGFYERQEISDIRNLLTVLVDPWNEMALLGFLRSPIGALSDESLMALSAERGLADSFQSELCLEEVEQNDRLNRARTLIAQLRARADSPLPSLLRHVITETGYDAILLAGRHGRQKVSNLRKLLDLAEGFSKTHPPRLPAFVRYLKDVASRTLREGDAPLPGEGEDSVTLMTIHKAKGLEFSIVVLADTARSTKGKTNMDSVRFHRRLGLVASCTDDFGERAKPLLWKSIDRAEQDTRRAEEARVLYVALTRARDWLLIAGAPAAAKSDSWLHAFEEVFGLSGYGDGEAIIGEGWSGVVRRRVGTAPNPPPRQHAESTFSMDDIEKRVSPIIVPSRSGSTLSVTQLVHRMDGGSTEDAAPETKPSQGGEGGGSVALLRGTMAHALFERWNFGVEKPAINPILIEFAPGLRDPDGHGVYLAGLAERFAQTELFGELSRAESLERELPFVWTIGGQPVSGTVDMVLDGSGIVDYKTGRFRADSHVRYERQVRLYALAMHRLTGIRASSAILQYVDETEGRREVDISEDALAEVLARAEDVLAPLAVPE
jgi:ATP-dependent exoDNAse (exonuclease V) beta subunit